MENPPKLRQVLVLPVVFEISSISFCGHRPKSVMFTAFFLGWNVEIYFSSFPTRFLFSLLLIISHVSQNASHQPPDKKCKLVASRIIWTGGEDAKSIQLVEKWSLTQLFHMILHIWTTSSTFKLHCNGAGNICKYNLSLYLHTVCYPRQYRNVPECFRTFTLCKNQYNFSD